MTIHTTLTGPGSSPKTLEEKRIKKVKSENLFILTDYNSNSLSMGINFEAELMRDLAVKSATP